MEYDEWENHPEGKKTYQATELRRAWAQLLFQADWIEAYEVRDGAMKIIWTERGREKGAFAYDLCCLIVDQKNADNGLLNLEGLAAFATILRTVK